MLPSPDSLETDPMQPNATRKGPILSSLLALLSAGALVAGCGGGGSEAPAHPAAGGTPPAAAGKAPAAAAKPPAPEPKAPETAPAVAKEASAPAATAPESAPMKAAPTEAATKSAAVPESTGEPKKAEAAAIAPTPEKPAADKADASKPTFTAAGAAETEKAKTEAAKKLGDPNVQEVDPNSKAKLTYEFGTDSKNFGKCMQGDVLTNKFMLQSSGEEDLVIKQAKPTCGCTVAQVAAQAADGSMAPYNFGQPIPSGRKIEITATLHTQNKRGHAASRINIFSNDPRGQTQLGLEADVDPFFQVNPGNLNFNALSSRDTANEKVTVTTTRGEKVKLAAALDNLPQGMKVEITPAEPDAEGKSNHWDIACHLGPGLVEGNLAYNVSLKSDIPIPGGEKTPNGAEPTYEVSVPVMARVTGMISYTPAFVSLGLIRPGQVVSRVIRLTSHDPAFKLGEPKVVIQGREGGEWDLANRFSTIVRPVAGENSIEVELRLDGMPETLNGSFSGTLDIQVGHPEKPEIKLPITGVCRGAAVGTPAAPGQGPAPTPAPQTDKPATPPK
jgi:hypothetical protein